MEGGRRRAHRSLSLDDGDLEALCQARYAAWVAHKYSLINLVLARLPGPRDTLQAINGRLSAPEAAGDCEHCAVGLRVGRASLSGSVADGLDGTHLFGSRPWPDSDYDYMLELDGVTELDGADDADGEGAGGDADGADACEAASWACPDWGAAGAGSDAGPAAVRYRAVPSPEHRGFFAVLRRPDGLCVHREPLPLPAGDVRDALEAAVSGGGVTPVSRHGPATTRRHDRFAVDYVPCLRVAWRRDWAAALRERPRPAGWPPPELLGRLGGRLHLVPVGPAPDERRLWRISFSRPEAVLARALPTRARFCLLLLRAVRRRCRDSVPLLSSYQLKTCTFWLCERRPARDWHSALGSARAVLDLLEEGAAAGFLPCFFWPEVNVLRQPTAPRLAQLCAQVRLLRRRLPRDLNTILRVFN